MPIAIESAFAKQLLSRLVGDALHDLQLPWQKLAVPHSQFELQCEFLCHAREKYPGRSKYERLPNVLSVGLRMDVDIFPFRAYRIQYESYIEQAHPTQDGQKDPFRPWFCESSNRESAQARWLADRDRKSTRLNSSHSSPSRMPSSA